MLFSSLPLLPSVQVSFPGSSLTPPGQRANWILHILGFDGVSPHRINGRRSVESLLLSVAAAAMARLAKG
jgi:hypothetical protein